VNLTWIAALLLFIVAFCLKIWGLSHGEWNWEAVMLLAFVLKTVSEHPKAP
jgi:hypothetical protein